MNSIGLQNNGIERFLSSELPAIASGNLKVIANVAMETRCETEAVLAGLSSSKEFVSSVELNISCPNVAGGGMTWGSDPVQASRAVKIAREKWEGPLWVKLTPQCNDIAEFAAAVEEAGADAVVVANTWLGMAIDPNSESPAFRRIFAGLSGPAVFPLALRLVWQASSAVRIPVIGCGGISRTEDVLAMMLAGASAVEIGTLHFTDLGCFRRICVEILDHLKSKGYTSAMDLVGRGKKSAC